MQRRAVFKALTAAAVLPIGTPSKAAPLDQVKMVVGYVPGTATDGLARVLAERMRGDYADNFVVENRAGASGQLALGSVKSAQPDGKTLLVSPIMTFVVVPHTFTKVSFDPFKDLIPIGNSVTTDFVLVVGPAVPANIKTLQEFAAWCRNNPSKSSFSTGATGSKIHFSGVRFSQSAGFNFTHVGYTSNSTALTDTAAGHVPAYIGSVATVLPFLDRVRVLGVMGARRSRFLPDVPTFVEAGYKDMVIDEAISLYCPARTPADTVQRLHSAMVKALSTPEAVKAMSTFGLEVTTSSQSEMANKIKTEYEQWGRFVKEIGFKQDS